MALSVKVLNAFKRGDKACSASVDEWVEFSDHPRQRNTEKRLAEAKKDHFRRYSQSWATVHAAWWNGKAWKLDGHGRCLGWVRDEIQRPPDNLLNVNLYYPRTEEEFNELYDHFDSHSSVKLLKHTLESATGVLNLNLRSTLLTSKFGWSSQLKRAAKKTGKGVNLYDLVEKWAPYIKALDDLMFVYKFPFLISIMLRCIRRDGPDEKYTRFFRGVFDGGGHKDDSRNRKDGIQCAVEYIRDVHGQGKKVSGWTTWEAIDQRILTAYELYRASKYVPLNYDLTKKPSANLDSLEWNDVLPMREAK